MKKLIKKLFGICTFLAAGITAIYAFRDKIRECKSLTTSDGTLKEPFATIVEKTEAIFDFIVKKIDACGNDLEEDFDNDDWDDDWIDDDTKNDSNREYTSIHISDDSEKDADNTSKEAKDEPLKDTLSDDSVDEDSIEDLKKEDGINE